jgi:hypothetical protein
LNEVFPLKLEKPSGYVEPKRLMFTPSVDMVSAQIRFLFKGEKSNKREIKVILTLRDAQGNVLFEGARRCRDHRVAAEELSTSRFQAFVWNDEKLRFSRDLFDRVASATVRFQDARVPQLEGSPKSQ